MRVLLLLGYFTNTGKFAGFISCEPKEWDRKFLDDFLPLRLEAIQTVNNSLKESQL